MICRLHTQTYTKDKCFQLTCRPCLPQSGFCVSCFGCMHGFPGEFVVGFAVDFSVDCLSFQRYRHENPRQNRMNIHHGECSAGGQTRHFLNHFHWKKGKDPHPQDKIQHLDFTKDPRPLYFKTPPCAILRQKCPY